MEALAAADRRGGGRGSKRRRPQFDMAAAWTDAVVANGGAGGRDRGGGGGSKQRRPWIDMAATDQRGGGRERRAAAELPGYSLLSSLAPRHLPRRRSFPVASQIDALVAGGASRRRRLPSSS
uniref:Uncharacterized protein n=1 Tax=Oryza meridionalis TaxID=40149 RepID=A0A0E0CKP0_9ORYZ